MEKVRSLIEKLGIDAMNTKDRHGKTPLLLLCKNYYFMVNPEESVKIFKLLIDKGADVNLADWNGKTPLLELCCHCRYDNGTDVIQLLMDTKGIPKDDPVGFKGTLN